MLRDGILTSFGIKGRPAPMTTVLYFQSKGEIYELPGLIAIAGKVGERRQFNVAAQEKPPIFNPTSRRHIPISGIVELG